MRVLMTTTRGAGHLGPLLPFARALRRSGASVLVGAPRSAGDMVRAEGLPAWFVDEPAPEERDAIIASMLDLTPDERMVRVVRDVFGRDARFAYPGLLEVCRRWRPDAVLSEACELAGPLVAERMGAPSVCVGISNAARSEKLLAVVRDTMRELRAGFGLADDPGGERLLDRPCFTLVPPALDDRPSRPMPTWRFREAYRGAQRPLPDWWPGDERPLVYVSFGSVVPTMDLFPGLYRAAIDAMSTLPVRALVTVGRERDPRELGSLPGNVHVERWVAQDAVMPHAAAMVCHGGSGSVRMGLAAGVPMAVLGLFADQPLNAQRVARLGAGIALEHGPDVAAAIRDAVGRLLDEAELRAGAARIAAEIRALPAVDEAVGVLWGLMAAPEARAAAA